MEETIEQSGNLKFSVDSNLLFELGERLVTKPSIALSELIKNAYDADATRATVIFDRVDKPGGVMIIEDNGHGMTFEEIENNWMRIATQVKREKPISRIYCRPLSGAKGVGRLAVRRLGTELTLQSIAETNDNGIVTKEMVVVIFKWEDKSFLPGQDLVNTPISYTRRPVPHHTKTGVTLLVEGVRDSWTKQEVINLRRDLLSVQSPYPDIGVQYKPHAGVNCQPDPGFNFELI
ncbi:MAG TPA: ATP-binding protein, partial [Methylomirabilota bacterium]|nr:ATP-binding protein [Methylomirabilota bacterium]